jgi:hypothetical protein
VVATALKLTAGWKRRRREAGERAFYDASDGLWPPVKRAPERIATIEADRPTVGAASTEARAEPAVPGD